MPIEQASDAVLSQLQRSLRLTTISLVLDLYPARIYVFTVQHAYKSTIFRKLPRRISRALQPCLQGNLLSDLTFRTSLFRSRLHDIQHRNFHNHGIKYPDNSHQSHIFDLTALEHHILISPTKPQHLAVCRNHGCSSIIISQAPCFSAVPLTRSQHTTQHEFVTTRWRINPTIERQTTTWIRQLELVCWVYRCAGARKMVYWG